MPAEQTSARPFVSRIEDSRSAKATILLAEDEPAVREATSEYLRHQGFVVLPARNGAEALEVARQYGEKIDLLLTDILMPIVDGKELAHKIAPLLPGIKVLFVSGFTDGALLQEDLESGASFMQKPYSFVSLAQKIRQLLGQPPQITERRRRSERLHS